jgi:hypothetical protein
MSIAPDQYATTGTPPAGWYADPSGAGQRWWDGGRWTEHVMPASAPAPTGPVAPSPDQVATPAPVATTAPATAASWIPERSNPLAPGTGYAVTPTSGPHRGPSGYVSPGIYVSGSSSGDTAGYGGATTIESQGPVGAGYSPAVYAAAGISTVPTAYRSTPATSAFPYSYLPGVPAPKNTKATVGFILGIVFVTVGVVFGYWFGSLLAVIVSITGLRRARTLAAQGYPAVGRGLAIWGIVLSALSWAVAVVLRLVAI